VIRVVNFGLVVMLVAALVSGACLACAPLKAGGCCDPSGHCKKVSKSCDEQPAVMTAVVIAVDLPVAVLEIAPSPLMETSFPVTAAEISPPDLCLLHSLLRV
jgi:hypothetical protein